MKRVFAVLACGGLLSACGSTNWSMPSMDMSAFKTAPATTSVRVESEPAGAEAKTPAGPGCRTPCTLALPASGTTVVSFSLQGYLPHSIPVTVTSSREAGDLPDSGAGDTVRIDPSPVFAALEVAPPPPPPPRKKAPPKAKPRPKPAPAAQAAPPPPPPQQQQQPGFGPPAGAPPQSVFR